MLAIRLSRGSFDLGKFLDKVETVCDQVIWFEHPRDEKVSRTHVHGLLEGCKVTVETLKNWLRFENSWAPTQTWDRSDWSFKEVYKSPATKRPVPVDKHCITYMSKGHLSPCKRKGFDDWEEYRKVWVDKPKIQKDLLDRQDPDSKATYYDMLRQLEDKLKLYQREVDDSDIIHEIIHIHKLNGKMISRYKVRDFYDSYKARNQEREFVAMVLNLCHKV